MSGSMTLGAGARVAAGVGARAAARAPLAALGPLGWVAIGALTLYDGYQIYNAMSKSDEGEEKLPAQPATDACSSCPPPPEDEEIISEDRAKHILDGDKSGGGHRSGTGKPGKTEFPKSWSDKKILGEISDVAKNGNVKGPAHRPGEVVKTGTRDGVNIEVVVKPDGSVRTGYPTSGPGVVRNPIK